MRKLLLLLSLVTIGCKSSDDREVVGMNYVITNLGETGFPAKATEVRRTNGIEYRHKNFGTDMYAMEFVAWCTMQASGYVFVDSDDIVRTEHVYLDREMDPENQIPVDMLRRAPKSHFQAVEPGSEVKYSSMVVMVKMENGWKALMINHDIY